MFETLLVLHSSSVQRNEQQNLHTEAENSAALSYQDLPEKTKIGSC